jgi:hypothetical protein
VEEVAGQVDAQKRMLEQSVSSCDVYCEVLKHVEDYVDTRWAAWLGLAKGETGRLVGAVCALYGFAEQALGDLLDRKQSQADHAAKEEKDCTEKYLSKWEQLDRHADAEMDRALEHRRVKEAARAEAQHYMDLRAGIRRLMELCRPVMAEYGVSVTGAERQSAVEEWDKRRIRLYNVTAPPHPHRAGPVPPPGQHLGRLSLLLPPHRLPPPLHLSRGSQVAPPRHLSAPLDGGPLSYSRPLFSSVCCVNACGTAADAATGVPEQGQAGLEAVHRGAACTPESDGVVGGWQTSSSIV